MHIISLFFSLFGSSVALFDHPLDEQKLTYGETPTDDITVEWQLVEEIIIFRITAKTKGWVGVGISREPSMKVADLILAGIKDGTSYVWDAYSNRNGPPSLDNEQYVDIISGRENATHTSVTVVRSRMSLDDEDLSDGNYYLLWAFGQRDLTGKSISFKDYHRRNRGVLPLLYAVKEDNPEVTSTHVDQTMTKESTVSPGKYPRATELSSEADFKNYRSTETRVSTELWPTTSSNVTDVERAVTQKLSSDGSYKYSLAFVVVAIAMIMVAAKSRLASIIS